MVGLCEVGAARCLGGDVANVAYLVNEPVVLRP